MDFSSGVFELGPQGVVWWSLLRNEWCSKGDVTRVYNNSKGSNQRTVQYEECNSRVDFSSGVFELGLQGVVWWSLLRNEGCSKSDVIGGV